MEYMMMIGMLTIAVLVVFKAILPQRTEEYERAHPADPVDTIKKRMNEFIEKRKRDSDEVMVPVGKESIEKQLSDSEELSDEEILKSVSG